MLKKVETSPTFAVCAINGVAPGGDAGGQGLRRLG